VSGPGGKVTEKEKYNRKKIITSHIINKITTSIPSHPLTQVMRENILKQDS
jgi:hypothetical protein